MLLATGLLEAMKTKKEEVMNTQNNAIDTHIPGEDEWITATTLEGTTIFDVCAVSAKEVETECQRLCCAARWVFREPVALVRLWKKEYVKRFTKAGKMRKNGGAVSLSYCRHIVLKYLAADKLQTEA